MTKFKVKPYPGEIGGWTMELPPKPKPTCLELLNDAIEIVEDVSKFFEKVKAIIG